VITFSIPRFLADRLSRLSLACDNTGVLAHIGVRIGPQQVRFCATNGRILASVIVPMHDLQGTSSEDFILDQVQFSAAMKAAAKSTGARVSMKVDNAEVRITVATMASVVRRISGVFPEVSHVWSRTAGRQWVPTTSSIDPHLVALAQKITGLKTAVLFSSPIEPAIRLQRLWASPGPEDHAETISLEALRTAVRSPAYWCSDEGDQGSLALLVMPITRADAERQLDLSAHAMAVPQATAPAAAQAA
jgi:hypothetical protein